MHFRGHTVCLQIPGDQPVPGKPFVLAETTWKTVRDTDYSVAILPWGATEAHNFHLPYGTDNYESTHVATESARTAWEKERESNRSSDNPLRRQHGPARHQALHQHESEYPGPRTSATSRGR